ncbi:serine-rich adhesin for platelets isoform X1 [Neodiprion pinetum]|uniref:serine-rich adhesin for platelets isoform X1 n=1 Tax=Neodiprion pinetum TaxID=441929 RepID=UPI001EDE4BB1|nr:uncharacterized protein LOC124218237 [Neodiprion pinetum]
MSINVTVNGNPVSIRRGRMVLSDLDQIKKNERDRRRKLRLEQVRQQSKEISNRLLERAKNVSKAQLTQLEKDGRSELRQMHDQKIMDLQRKYQEDMEDIGRAHASAALQPDVETLLEAERKKNRLIAAERGREARQRLKDSTQVDDDHTALHERQRQVREMENARASMVANLPKKSCTKNDSDQDSDSSGNENTVRTSPKKKPDKKVNRFQTSVPKVVVQSSDVQVVVSNPKAKRTEPQPGPSRVPMHKAEIESKRSTNKTVTNISDFPRVITGCESDDQKPRKNLPTLNSPSKANKVASYNPQDYKPDSTSSISSTSSSPTTLSDDSSYFSDGAIDQMVSKKTPRHTTSAASSKVQLYDHNTRQRNVYDKPFGVVERININGEPNAEQLARAVTDSENANSCLAENRRRHAQRRGNDAILRERVRRDYENLLHNLDHLSREERKLKASQIHGPPVKDIYVNPMRRQELLAKRQKDMDFAFETIAQDGFTRTEESNLSTPVERVVTIPPINEQNNVENTHGAVWHEPPFLEPLKDSEEDQEKKNEMSRDEQILEMLRKVERQKRLLLKEFGANLSDNIFSASVKPLFTENTSTQTVAPKKKVQPSPVPEIKVVNLSSCDEIDKNKLKKGKKKVSAPPKKIEIAVQTSTLDDRGEALDKSVQVELINGQRSSSSNSTSRENGDELKSYDTLLKEDIAVTKSNSGSSDSTETGIVIDIKKKHIKVTPRKKRSHLRLSRRNSPRVISKPRLVPGGKISTPVKKLSKSTPVSKQGTPRSNISNVQPIKINNKKVKIQLDKGGIKVKINPPPSSQMSRDASTESSKDTLIETSQERTPVPTKHTKTRDSSDTSTSYRSPPPPTPASYRSVRNNSTPILEILESSELAATRSKKRGISPVSSPGTPSPRTINLPTNTPHSRQIHRVLEFFDSTISQSPDNTMVLTFPGRQSTPNEMSNYVLKKLDSSEHLNKSPDICACKNPQCKLTHSNIQDIQNYSSSKNYPKILKKYQDLQSMCTDRIASLTDLIEKVRSEQRGMELSVGGQSDESTMFQVPGPPPMSGDLQSVRQLVNSIEAIHSQLAKTLNESQRIIATEKLSKQPSKMKTSSTQPSVSTETDENSPFQSSVGTGTHSSVNNEVREVPRMGIPRIISSERVNIPLSHFNLPQKPMTSLEVTAAQPISPARRKSPRQKDDVVERLSKEILEQSKALDNLFSETTLDYSNFTSIQSPPLQHVAVASPERQTSPSPKKQGTTSSQKQDCSGSCAESFHSSGSKTEKDSDFIPLLAGIPKIQRMTTNIADNHRPRPPVTLIYGPHSIQTGSPGHELSTIVEFDTPDTASKSHKSAKSPSSNKSRKNLSQNCQHTAGKPTSPSAIWSRTPVHASSPLALPSTSKSPTKGSTPSPITQSVKQISIRDSGMSRSPESQDKCEATCPQLDTKSSQKTAEVSGMQSDNTVLRNHSSPESSSSIPDISLELQKRNLIFHAQIPTVEAETPFRPKESRQPVTSVSTQLDKDKITSTSSNSFSGLSGISEITSTPTSDILKYTSSPEEMEAALKKLGLGWAITTLKKTREASALSSSSNSDTTPVNPSRKMISPVMKKDHESKINCLPNLSDVSSISIRDANKSTERALLLKARTSTPNIENSNSSCEKPISSITTSSRASPQDQSDSLTAPNLSLTTKKTTCEKSSNEP